MTFVAIVAALLLALPMGAVAQQYEPPTEEQEQEQQEQQERERQTERQKMHEQQKEQKEQQEQQAMERPLTNGAQPGQMTTVSIPVETVSADELTQQPREYFGKTVQISAQVSDVHGDRLFTLEPEHAGVRTDVPSQRELLVVIPRDVAANIPQGEAVQVVGHVRPLVKTEFERDYAWFELDWFEELEQAEGERPGLAARLGLRDRDQDERQQQAQQETERQQQAEREQRAERGAEPRTDGERTERFGVQMRDELRPVLIATSIKTEDGRELMERGSDQQQQRRPGVSQ